MIGAGAAGSLVARKVLDAGGGTVVLVEAGPDYGARVSGLWPTDLLNADTLPTSHDWGYSGPGHGGTWHFGRAKVIGGCTAHNGCSQTSGLRADYEALGIAWGHGELDARVRDSLDVGRATVPRDAELTPFQSALIDAFDEVGVPRTDDLADLDGRSGCGPAPMNSPGGVRWNNAFTYLDEVRGSERLEILAGATVDRLILNGTTAVAALCVDEAGKPEMVRAAVFVLCAGAYGSPEILLRSGIGPADDLADLGIGVAVDLPGVGANLHDHPTVEVRFEASAALVRDMAAFEAERRAPDEQVIGKVDSGAGTGPYDLHVFPYTDHAGDRLECVLPAGAVVPRSRGRLRLRSTDPAVRSHLEHAYMTDPAGTDVATLRAGLDFVRALGATTSFAPLLNDLVADRSSGSDHTFFHYWHPAGTCALGIDPAAGAVVDVHGRVHGTENIRVVDASVFPQVPRATTHLPTTLLADRLSDDLVGRAFTPPHGIE